jgi:acetyl esterase/lipase
MTMLRTPKVFAPLLVLLGLLASSAAQAQSCQTYPNLTYATWTASDGSTQPLQLELLVPSGTSAPVPVVVWIHGGGWFSGSRLPIPSGVSALCSQGYAVASVDYRLVPDAIWPAQLHDVKAAVRWLRAHADSYGLDPDRFAAWGDSAGGHLAATLGTTGGLSSVTIGRASVDLEGSVGDHLDESSRVQAVVDWYGATDFLQMRFYPTTSNHDAMGSPESKFVGGPIQKNPERSATANPISHVSSDDPPFLVMHGTIDDLIPFNQSELLVEALRQRGVPVSFVPVPEVGHGGGGFTTSANYQAVYSFLDARLRDLGAATVGVTATDANASEAGSGTATFTLSRTGSLAAPLTVRWALSGTAEAGPDFGGPTRPVTIPAGQASAAFTIHPLDDGLIEGAETVILTLAHDPAYRIDVTRMSAQATIADNDSSAGRPVVTLEAVDPDLAEAGLNEGSFRISLDGALAADLEVRYTVGGTAINGKDYSALYGSVVISAGETSALVEVVPVDDLLAETGESVILSLAPSSSYGVGAPSTSSGVLTDSELDPQQPTAAIVSVATTDPSGSEPGTNKGAFTLTRTGPTSSALTVNLTFGGSAVRGSDYSVPTHTVQFGSGVSRLLLLVTPVNDAEIEGPETVSLSIVPPTGGFAGPWTGIVTIADDEASQGVEGFYPLVPCRLVDTRGPAGPWGAPRLQGGAVRVFPASGVCGIPPEAEALSVNVTAADPSTLGHLRVFEGGGQVPSTSLLNFQPGLNRANNAIIPLAGFPRSLAVFGGLAPSASVDVVIDVNGYFR